MFKELPGPIVTEQDTVGGASWDRPLPIFSVIAPLWSTQVTVTHEYFLSFFQMLKWTESRSVVSVGPHRLYICDPMDYTVHGILQARMLKWVAVPFSRESSQPRDWTQVSHIAGRFFTSWDTREAQEYCSGYPFSSGSSWPKNRIGVSSIAGGFFMNWAIRKALRC